MHSISSSAAGSGAVGEASATAYESTSRPFTRSQHGVTGPSTATNLKSTEVRSRGDSEARVGTPCLLDIQTTECLDSSFNAQFYGADSEVAMDERSLLLPNPSSRSPSKAIWDFALRLTQNAFVFILTILACSLLVVGRHVIRSTTPRRPTSCPSPHDTQEYILDRHRQICSPIPSSDSKFSIQICHDPLICNAFTVTIERNDLQTCQRLETLPHPSLDPILSKWIKHRRGPDAFLIKTDGAQRYVSTWSDYHGDCSYAFDVRLRNAGLVYLRMWRTFERYEAFSETNKSWPEQLWSPLTPGPIELDICTSECEPYTSPLLFSDQTLFRYPIKSVPSKQALPGCTGPKPIRGFFMPINPLDVLYPAFGIPMGANSTPVVNRYRFVPESCEFRHAGLRFQDPTPCTTETKRVLLWGDSHARVVHDALGYRMQGHRGIYATSDTPMGDRNASIGNMRTEVHWDPRGLEWTDPKRHEELCSRISDVDAFGLSVGAHIAVDFSTAEYTTNLTAILKQINSCPKPPKKRVYFTTPAQPPRQDFWVTAFNDHRTNVRLQYWSSVGEKIALEFGWSVVDQYQLTIPFHEEVMSLDMAHYFTSDALDPILDEAIEKLVVHMSSELDVIFTGKSAQECDDFIRAVCKYARINGKTWDNSWIAEQVYDAFSGKARRWYLKQPPDVQKDWSLLQKELMDHWVEEDEDNSSDLRRRSGENPPSAPPAHALIPTPAAAASSVSASGPSEKIGRLKFHTGQLQAPVKFLSKSTFSGAEEAWRRGSFLLTSDANKAMTIKLVSANNGLWRLEMLAHPSERKLVAGYFFGPTQGYYGLLVGVDDPAGTSLKDHKSTFIGGSGSYDLPFKTAVWILEDEGGLSFVWSENENDDDRERIPIIWRPKDDTLLFANFVLGTGDNEVKAEFEVQRD